MSSRAKLGFVTVLTFLRLPLVLFFFVGAIVHAVAPCNWVFVVTFACLIAASVTDLFDGYFARKFQVVTKFGAHADPLMDKFFYLASLPLLVFVATKEGHVAHGVTLLVLTMLFLARDQWVTFLRSIGSLYNVSGGANWSGKLRTGINFPMICCVYHFEESPWQFISKWFIQGFELLALVITVVSLYVYTRRYWPYLRKSASVTPAAHPNEGA